MPRKQRRTKIKNNSCNNSDEEPQEPQEQQASLAPVLGSTLLNEPIYFKPKYNKVQTLKINEITDNFLKCNIISFNSF